jgi:hypothetical protein
MFGHKNAILKVTDYVAELWDHKDKIYKLIQNLESKIKEQDIEIENLKDRLSKIENEG